MTAPQSIVDIGWPSNCRAKQKNVVVTGAAGFLGRNLTAALGRREDVRLSAFDQHDSWVAVAKALNTADVIYHLAGVNRPDTEAEFWAGNRNLTQRVIEQLKGREHLPVIVFPSSIHAEDDTPYGLSKRAAEEALLEHNRKTGAPIQIYRLPNVFGKWSRPDYNSVVATFCHKIARGEEIHVADPDRLLQLAYIDDVVAEFLDILDAPEDSDQSFGEIHRTFQVTVLQLAEKIRMLNGMRHTRFVPDSSDELTRCLHATFTSFLPPEDLEVVPETKQDARGWLFELVKSNQFGQIFVSETLPGVTRGNHYHDSKVEKFCVIRGKASIRLEHLTTGNVYEYEVTDSRISIVDVPPGFAHSITNIGSEEMITLFWANQVFEPDFPDTYAHRS